MLHLLRQRSSSSINFTRDMLMTAFSTQLFASSVKVTGHYINLFCASRDVHLLLHSHSWCEHLSAMSRAAPSVELQECDGRWFCKARGHRSACCELFISRAAWQELDIIPRASLAVLKEQVLIQPPRPHEELQNLPPQGVLQCSCWKKEEANLKELRPGTSF